MENALLQPSHASLSVLLVDDSSIALAFVGEFLKSHRYEVTAVETAKKALDIFDDGNFDILVIDYEMPGISGRELMKQVHELSPLTPVIILSGHDEDAELAVSLIRDGAVDFLTKSKNQERFLGALRKANASAFQKKALNQEIEVWQNFEMALNELDEDLQGKIDRGQEELQDSQTRLRAILDTAVDAIITIDFEGKIESANLATAKMFGYAQEELIGHNIRGLMPPPYCDEHSSYLARYIRTGTAKIIGIGRDAVAQHQDGTIFPVHIAISQAQEGLTKFFTGFIRDMSDHKSAEAILQQYEVLAEATC